MKFHAILTKLIPKDFGSRSDLAKKIGVTVNYITDIAAGRRKAPTLIRCSQIASALHLSKEEADQLIQAAARERLPQEELDIITESLAEKAIRENIGAVYEWSSIKGTADCPHCGKELELEVNQKGEFFVSGRVRTKVKKENV